MTPDENVAIDLDESRKRLAEGEFAFVDGGCGSGGSIAYCERIFQKGRGIGFDSSAEKVARAVAAGHTACQADLGAIDLPSRSVYFVSLLDFLEHLPDLDTTRSILSNMARVARDFVFIRHPSFEEVDYLEGLGLKLDWTDWHGHSNMMKLADFDRLARELDLPAPTILGQKPIADSTHASIVPLAAPRDTVGYDAERHGAKDEIRFDRTIYSQYDIFVRVNPDLTAAQWSRITSHVMNPRHVTTMLSPGGVPSISREG
jgi:SAM-dependent methyltransferase